MRDLPSPNTLKFRSAIIYTECGFSMQNGLFMQRRHNAGHEDNTAKAISVFARGY
jgi:hypothetical protein